MTRIRRNGRRHRIGRRRFRPIAVAVSFALLIAACGIPVSDGVELIAQEDHRELLEGTTSTTIPEADPTDEDAARVGLYFIGPDDKLERVTRAFPDGTTRDEVLEALAAGPQADEIEESGLETLVTQLPVGLNPRFGPQDEERQSQAVEVDPEGQLRIIVEEQPVLGRLIVTQIVCTALGLQLGDVTGIIITDGGEEPIVISDINAETLQRPANRADFDDCKTGAEERAEAEDAEAEAEGEADGETDADPDTDADGETETDPTGTTTTTTGA